MPFHRTPAVMAADVSFARSPAGESLSRHLLWLTDIDLAEIGAEPQYARHRIDFNDRAAVETDRAAVAAWKVWWAAIGSRVSIRQREARSDDAWAAEYATLVAARRAAGPAELQALQAEWAAYDEANPERGLTDEEIGRRTKAWARRHVLVEEHARVKRRDAKAPRLDEIIVEIRECDRIVDDLNQLEHARVPMKRAA